MTDTLNPAAPTTNYTVLRDSETIWDVSRLLARIGNLDADGQARLAELWSANGHPSLAGVELLPAETYKRLEASVDVAEQHNASGDAIPVAQMRAWAARIADFPERLREGVERALDVYADATVATLDNPPLVMSVPRIAEIERIVSEALAYLPEFLAEIEGTSSVDDLDPVPAPDVELTDDLPSAKATAEHLLGWVGEDRNRAARAWAQEHDRPKPRKGVVSSLTKTLGDGVVARVQEVLAANAPPPMPLGNGLQDSGAASSTALDATEGPPTAAPDVVEGTAGDSEQAPESGDGSPIPEAVEPSARDADAVRLAVPENDLRGQRVTLIVERTPGGLLGGIRDLTDILIIEMQERTS